MTWREHIPPLRYLLALVVGIVALLGLGAFLFALSGFYNVAASSGHRAVTRWFLELGMQRSVKLQSAMIEASPLEDDGRFKLGLGHYQGGCAPCHGAPGVQANPIATGMLPPPPALRTKIGNWTDAQLFWIVKHGLKYTGMPAWVTQKRDDEVWAVVAFLRRLPDMEASEYERLARGNIEKQPAAENAMVAVRGPATYDLTACMRCHDSAEKPPTSSLVPRLAGQNEAFISRALEEYRAGERASGVMQPIAAKLDDRAIERLAQYFAQLSPVPASEPASEAEREATTSSALISAGRELYLSGSPSEQVPACVSCHGPDGLETYPRLAGQSADYLVGQLKLWQEGKRSDTQQGAIMAPIANRLSQTQIDAVTAYVASMRPMASSVTRATED